MKKHLFTPALAILAIVGCSKVITPELPDQEISFETAYYSAQTKADGHGHNAFEGTFNVNAYYTGDTEWAAADLSTAVVYMPDVEISKQGDVWKATTGTYYWPKTGNLSFVGYAGWAATPAKGTAKASFLTFADQVIGVDSDPMVSDIAVNLSANPNATHFTAGVPILFHHTASQVAFKAIADGETGDGAGLKYEIEISNVTIKSMNTKGTYTVDGNNAAINGAWSNQSVPADRVIINAAQAVTETASAVGQTGTVLPQSVSGLVANVTYKIIVKNAATDAQMSEKEFADQKVSLETATITEWVSNKRYIYTIKIKPVSGEIEFDPAVVDWDEVEA